jgi:hypothetical protein
MRALSEGSAEITVSAGNEKLSFLIHAKATRVALSKLSIVVTEFAAADLIKDVHELHVGDVLHVSAALTPRGAEADLRWQLSDESVLTLEGDPDDLRLRAVGEGSSELKLSAAGLSDTLVFFVLPAENFNAGSNLIIPVAIVLFAIVLAAVLYFVIRGRKGKKTPAAASVEKSVENGASGAKSQDEASNDVDENFWESFTDNRRDDPLGITPGAGASAADNADGRDNSRTLIFDGPLTPPNGRHTAPDVSETGEEIKKERGKDRDKPFSLDDVD